MRIQDGKKSGVIERPSAACERMKCDKGVEAGGPARATTRGIAPSHSLYIDILVFSLVGFCLASATGIVPTYFARAGAALLGLVMVVLMCVVMHCMFLLLPSREVVRKITVNQE